MRPLIWFVCISICLRARIRVRPGMHLPCTHVLFIFRQLYWKSFWAAGQMAPCQNPVWRGVLSIPPSSVLTRTPTCTNTDTRIRKSTILPSHPLSFPAGRSPKLSVQKYNRPAERPNSHTRRSPESRRESVWEKERQGENEHYLLPHRFSILLRGKSAGGTPGARAKQLITVVFQLRGKSETIWGVNVRRGWKLVGSSWEPAMGFRGATSLTLYLSCCVLSLLFLSFSFALNVCPMSLQIEGGGVTNRL